MVFPSNEPTIASKVELACVTEIVAERLLEECFSWLLSAGTDHMPVGSSMAWMSNDYHRGPWVKGRSGTSQEYPPGPYSKG